MFVISSIRQSQDVQMTNVSTASHCIFYVKANFLSTSVICVPFTIHL